MIEDQEKGFKYCDKWKLIPEGEYFFIKSAKYNAFI